MTRPPRFGAHIGLQDTTPESVLRLAVGAEERGFDWVSVWDHFYSASPADGGSLDAVAMHAALATATRRVRCGVLVYSTSYRHPGVLAKAAATVDLLSGGRAEIGLGAGFAEREHHAYGIALRPPAQRLDVLGEAAKCVRMLLHDGAATFAGRHFRLVDAQCTPRPIQAALPIWIGGRGERRTLRIVAESADGWNGSFLSPAEFARKRVVLHEHCAAVGRDPALIRCAANVGIAVADLDLDHHFRTMNDVERRTRGAVLTGAGQHLVDQIGAYLDAGADQVNFTWRAPFGLGALDELAAAVATLRG